RRYRRHVQPASARERNRQLRESRAARSSAYRSATGRESGRAAAAGSLGRSKSKGALRKGERTTMSTQAVPRPPEQPWKPKHNAWLIALTVTMATFMEVLDTSIANVSLPHIAGNLSAGQDEATWVLTSYLVSNAIVLPLS